MTAAGAIVRKDIREFLRDGRALVALGIVALLSVAAFWLSAQRVQSSEEARTAAARLDRRTWEGQGRVNPHGAAHFSSWAFKPQTALSVFEPGLTPYYGEAIWMEAHHQNPANHRPAEDATEARRFADLSPAWLAATLLPLFLIGLGFASLAREREGGQWRQMAASGVSARSVLAGKARMLVGLGMAITVLFTVPALFAGSALPAPGDAPVRWLLIVVAALLFATALVAVVLAVSAACRTARAALLGLVGFWMLSVVLAPRLIASAAEVLAPAPSLHTFTEEVRTGLQAGIPPDQAPPALVKRLEDDTLERYGARRLEDLPVNFEGILLQASEDHGNAVFDRQFGELRVAHRRQQGISRLAGLVSPVVAFRNATAAFAGTDGAHHWHFAAAAEEHRRLTVRMLNDHLIRHAGGAVNGLAYQADPALWATIPEFSYRPPGWTVSAAALVDLAILAAWGAAGFGGAWLAMRRWRSGMSLIRHDVRLLARDRVAAGSVIAFLTCLAVALLLGHDWAEDHRRALGDHLSEDRFDLTEAKRPIDVALPVVMPAPPLLDLAVGRTDLEPSRTATSFWAREDALFEDYQVDGPLALAAGRFDLAFVTVWLAPVLLIALGLSLVSAERDSGLLRMQAAASGSLGRRALARAGLRWVIVSLPVAGAATIGTLLAPAAPGMATHLALWVAAAGAYLLFWQAAVLLVSSFRLRQEALGAALLALWALVIAVFPAFAAGAAQAVNPPPSRFSLIAEGRRAYQEAFGSFSEELKSFLGDHPDLSVGQDVAGYIVTNAALTGKIEEALRPTVARFDQARAAQRDVARWFELLSPALLTHRLLADAAGSGEAAHAHFRKASIGYHRRVHDTLLTAAVRGTDLGPPELAAIPRFDPPGGTPVRGTATAVAGLVAGAGLIATLGSRRLSRPDVAL